MRIYKQNLSRLIRLPDFFGITDSSGLIPLSQIRDNGIINNGSKQPTVAELEQQAKNGQAISLLALAEAVHREEQEQRKAKEEPHKGRPSVLSKLKAPVAPRATGAMSKKQAEREI